jgi:hypothetical protein
MLIKLRVQSAHLLLVLLLYGISFVLINFWPWYNHTVFVLQLVAMAFAVASVYSLVPPRKYVLIIAAAFFAVWAFFTKQDGGAMAIMFVAAIVLYDTVRLRKPLYFVVYAASVAVLILLYVLPFLPHGFDYWFNYGQEPHYSRVNSWDIIARFFEDSLWIKFYIAAALFIAARSIVDLGWKAWWQRPGSVLFFLITLGILLQALIIQVTSFSPATGTLYYHTFGMAFIISHLAPAWKWNRVFVLGAALMVIFIWHSEHYWHYGNDVLKKLLPKAMVEKPKDVVSIGNWAAEDSVDQKKAPIQWVYPPLPTMRKIRIPEETYEGVLSIKNLPVVQAKGKDLKVLNMSELTTLPYDIGYEPLHGERYPLWFHKGVSVFDRDIVFLCSQVAQKEYDLILFERVEEVDNYFPYDVLECVKSNYTHWSEFEAPTGYGNTIEVYVRNEN